MKRFNKKFMLITILSGTIMLSGCDKVHLNTFNASKDGSNPKVTATADNKQGDTDTKANNKVTDSSNDAKQAEVSDTPTPSVIQPVANRELPIYSINVETGDIEPATALIPEKEKITPDLIVNTVVESMADQSITVGIDSVTTKKDAVIVSFKGNQAPYKNMGAGFEGAILNAIAQSLIDNLKDYSKVIYRVDNEAYVSDHIVLGINEVYLGDN